MNLRFIIDLAFFLATLTTVTIGGKVAFSNLYQLVRKETLITVQKGLPKMEPFALKLTGWRDNKM